MKQNRNRLIAFLLIAVMALGMIPFAALPVSAAAGDNIVVGTDGYATNIEWEAGYVGAPDNQYAGPWALSNPNWNSGYRRTQVFTVPNRGTTLVWSESTSKGTQSSAALIVSSWKQEEGAWVIDKNGTYVRGSGTTSNTYTTYDSSSQTITYTYTTASDNEHLRLGAYGGKADGTWATTSAECPKIRVIAPQTGEDDVATAAVIAVGADNIVSNVTWRSGFVGSGTNQASGQAWNTFYRAWELSGRLTDYLIVPDAYTTLVWSESTKAGTCNTDMLTVASYKEVSTGVYAIDQSRMQIMGDVSSGAAVSRGIQIADTEAKTVTYAYTTTHANEIVRLGCFGGLADGTLSESSEECPQIYAYHATFAEGAVAGIRWFDGSIDTSFNRTTYSNFTKGENNYVYSMPILIPNAGTTVSFRDTMAPYAESDKFVLTTWAPSKDGSLSMIYGLTGGSAGEAPHITTGGAAQIYTYTSSYDNEVIRLCLRSDKPARSTTVAVSYTENDAQGIAFLAAGGYREGYTGEQFLPEITFTKGTGIGAGGALRGDSSCAVSSTFSVFAPGTVISFTDMAGFASDLLVFSTYNASGTFQSGIAADQPYREGVGGYKDNADGSRTYYYVTTETQTRLRISFSAVGNLTAGGLLIAPVVNTVASADKDYSDVLQGLTIYSIGDSYFAGVNIDRSTIWLSRTARHYDMTSYNYHISGSTVCAKGTESGYTNGSNPMVLRYTNMPSDPNADIVIFEGGRNDYNGGSPMGTVNDKNTTTFYGSLRTVIDGLLEKYPNAVILCVTAWDLRGRNETPHGEGYQTCDYVDAYVNLVNTQYASNDRVRLVANGDSSQFPVYMLNSDFQKTYNMTDTDISHFHSKGHAYVMPYFEQVLAENYMAYQNTIATTAVTAQDPATGINMRYGTAFPAAMTLPTVANDGFVGWFANKGGDGLLLPGGAVYECEKNEDTAFTALYIDMTTDTAEARAGAGLNGIRFVTEMSDLTAWTTLNGVATAVGRGTLILPANKVTAYSDITHAALNAAGQPYLDVPAADWYGDAAGTFAGSILSVRPENYLLDFAARGYVSITFESGETTYVYASDSAVENVYHAAQAALADVSDTQTAVYTEAVGDGTFSPYTAEQRAVFAAYSNAIVYFESVAASVDPSTMALRAGQIYTAVTVQSGDEFAALFLAMGDPDVTGFVVVSGPEALTAANVAGVILDGAQIRNYRFIGNDLVLPIYEETAFY